MSKAYAYAKKIAAHYNEVFETDLFEAWTKEQVDERGWNPEADAAVGAEGFEEWTINASEQFGFGKEPKGVFIEPYSSWLLSIYND